MGTMEGKVAWITGGGSGIGRAVAEELAGRGVTVVVSGRRLDKLEETVGAITDAGGRASALRCDVGDDGDVARAVEAIVNDSERLDYVIANAGFSVMGRFEKLTEEDWIRQIDINVHGVVRTARHGLPELRKTQGRLVLVSSVSGMICIPNSSAYSASKFAVRAIGLTLTQELAGSGVSCTTVYPGFVESEIINVDNQGRYHANRQDQRPKALMWSAASAARSIVKAAERRKSEHVFTGHGKLAGWLGRHAPGLVSLAMRRGRR